MLYLQYPDWISPVIIPGLPFRWYAVMYLVAFAFAWFLFRIQAKERQLKADDDLIMSFFFWAIVGLLAGGRLFAVTIYDTLGIYRQAPWLAIWPFDTQGNFTGFQGMSYHGAVVGIVVSLLIFARVKKINLLEWGDMLAIATPLGYTFGRIGNFINGELYGRVSDLPWAMQFPNARPLSMAEPWVAEMAGRMGISPVEGADVVNLPRHPSQLYEAFAEGIVLFFLLWFIVRPRKGHPGLGMSMYLIGYGALRFIVEYTREPDAGLDYVIRFGPANAPTELFESIFNITMGQVLCLLMIAAGLILYFVTLQIHRKQPTVADYALAEQEEKQDARNARRKIRKKLK